MSSGVYRIVCSADNRTYVGSAVDLEKRKREHFSALAANRHHNRYLQRAYNKYGNNCFIFEVILNCGKGELLSKEEEQIYKHDSFNSGFNLVEFPTSTMLGYKHTPETRQKIGEARKGTLAPNRSLAREQVVSLRRMWWKGQSVTKLAEEFALARRTISNCIYLKTYQEFILDDPVDDSYYMAFVNLILSEHSNGNRLRSRGWKHSREFREKMKKVGRSPKKSIRRLTKEQVLEIRRTYEQGETYKSLSEKFKVNQSSIGNIIRGITYKDIH